MKTVGVVVMWLNDCRQLVSAGSAYFGGANTGAPNGCVCHVPCSPTVRFRKSCPYTG